MSADRRASPTGSSPPEPQLAERRRLPFNPWHLLLFPLALIMLLPLVWMVVTSLETPARDPAFPAGSCPAGDPLQNYPNALHGGAVRPFFINSTIVTVTVVVGNLVFCSLAGYAFARINFPGKNVVFILLLATLMVPFQVTMIPAFLIVKSARAAIDSLGALIVPSLVQVFGIFMLRQFFRTLPIELEEAARIDGASRLGVLFKIILPLSLPALSTLAVMMFLFSWNDFLWPLIVDPDAGASTVQLGLADVPGRARHAVDAPHGRRTS